MVRNIITIALGIYLALVLDEYRRCWQHGDCYASQEEW